MPVLPHSLARSFAVVALVVATAAVVDIAKGDTDAPADAPAITKQVVKFRGRGALAGETTNDTAERDDFFDVAQVIRGHCV